MYSSLWDSIERLEHSFKLEGEINHKTKIREYYFEEITVNELKALLNNEDIISSEIVTTDHHCSDCGGYPQSVLAITYALTEDEKRKELDQCMSYRRSSASFINKCLLNNPDQKNDCIRILKNKNLLQYFYF